MTRHPESEPLWMDPCVERAVVDDDEQQEIDQHEQHVAATGKEESPEHVKVEKEEQEREPQHTAHHPQHGGCSLQITCGQIGDERRDENHHRPYQKQHQKQRYVFLTYSSYNLITEALPLFRLRSYCRYRRC